MDLALNNLQRLICHKTQQTKPNQTKLILDRNTWNHITVWKVFVFDRNTWNHITMSKLFVLDKNTWNHTTLCKLFILDENTWNYISMRKLKDKSPDIFS